MLRITERVAVEAGQAEAFLTLPFERRTRSRLRERLDDGREVGLFLTRGTVLRHGDRLRAENGLIVEVQAALERVSTGRSSDALRLARACYYLGNRHVSVQIGAGWIRYGHDPVLDAMVQELGLTVAVEDAPFEPEAGAYPHGAGYSHLGEA